MYSLSSINFKRYAIFISKDASFLTSTSVPCAILISGRIQSKHQLICSVNFNFSKITPIYTSTIILYDFNFNNITFNVDFKYGLISGSHGSEYEDYCLLGYYAM
jgi:hypothetical protein